MDDNKLSIIILTTSIGWLVRPGSSMIDPSSACVKSFQTPFAIFHKIFSHISSAPASEFSIQHQQDDLDKVVMTMAVNLSFNLLLLLLLLTVTIL